MMGLETIRAMNDEACEKAQQERVRPVLLTQLDKDLAESGDYDRISRFPHIGGYLPEGYSRRDITGRSGVYDGDNEGYGAFFVDATGMGSLSEPALTVDQFIKELEVGAYYAIIEAGQFQVKIASYDKA